MDFKNLTAEQLVEFIKDVRVRGSKRRMLMEESFQYYSYNQDIERKERLMIGDRGKVQKVYNLPNNKLTDNQFAKVVDQKVNYLFSKIPLIRCKDDAVYQEKLVELFDKKFLRTLNKIALDSYLYGISWLYVYEEEGRFKYKKMDSPDIVPIWEDKAHESLTALIRSYSDEIFENGKLKVRDRLDFFTADVVYEFEINDGGEYVLMDTRPYFKAGDKGFQFGKIPFIYFKANSNEEMLLRKCKSLQDAINVIMSNFMDNMLEDPRNTILVIKNYDGQDLGEFRNNLATYGAVKVTTADGMQGGVESLEIKVNFENYKAILSLLKEKLIENTRGIDLKNDRSSQAPNELNIKSMYADIELDANAIELEFTASLSYMEWFFRKNLGLPEDGATADIEFKRNIMVNEESQVTMIKNSYGILSRETLIGNHPMVDDVEEELKRIEEEQTKETDSYTDYGFLGDSHDEA